jgi:peptidoglycan/xylan/chitin deacetylase (PgdA/CDA1 family)
MASHRPHWPGGAHCVVVLTFDNLGEALDLLRHGYAGGAFSDGVYSPRRGVQRVLDILTQRNITATFFVEGWGAEKYPHVVEDIVSEGHEIGAHGWMHETWNELAPDQERQLILRATDTIETVAKTRPSGWRAPSGLATPHMLGTLYDLGYAYDSSFTDDDVPYRIGIAPDREEDMVELPWAWNTDDAAYYAYPGTIVRPSEVAATWIEEFDAAYQQTGFFNLVCHPRYTGRPSRIRALETLIDHIAGHDGVQFLRCDEVARIVRSSSETPLYPAPRESEEADAKL